VKLSPLDIRHKEFQSALNGFNKGQVRDFLDRAADQFEERLEQIQQLSEQIKKQEKEIEQLRVSDIELKRTLVTSERLSGEVKLQAEREAELLLKETQSKADVILRDAELQKRQLLKTAEIQVSEATIARQKAEEAAKRIREQSIQDAAVQKQRAQNMVAGLKEQAPNTTDADHTNSEALTQEHAKKLAKLRHKSKTIIGQMQKDIAKLKNERGQMLEQLQNYDKHLAVLEQKEKQHSSKSQTYKPLLSKSQASKSQASKPQANTLKTKQVAHALSTSIDNLMPEVFTTSDNSSSGTSKSIGTPSNNSMPSNNNVPGNNTMSENLLSAESLGLNTTSLNAASLNSTGLNTSTVNPVNDLQTTTATKNIAPQRKVSRNNSAHDISYPKMDSSKPTEANSQKAQEINSDNMKVTITPFEENAVLPKTGRYAKERQLEKEHLRNQKLNFVETKQTDANGLSQHIYPSHPVKESSVQDRGRLITPLTIHDTAIHDTSNPFINDGFDEIDSLGTFSEAMVAKDSGIKLKGKEFDSNIFNVEDTLLSIEDTLELPNPHTTVEHIEVLDTDWFDNFELDDD